MASKKLIRPSTGRLLVGGDFYKHTGYGVDRSWLSTENPKRWLFKHKDFSGGKESFGARFVRPAMRSEFSDLLLDIPMARDNGALKQSQGITVLYLPEGELWVNARPIAVLSWNQDIVVSEEVKGETLRAWRQWDDAWFRERVLRDVEEDVAETAEEVCVSQQTVIDLARLEQIRQGLSSTAA